MNVCLFDDVVGGHHGPFLQGLARAATKAGHFALVASPEPVAFPDSDGGRWMQIPATTHRQVIKGRRTVRRLLRWAESADIDVLLDLYLDKTIWTWRRDDMAPPTVHILHHAHHYLPDAPLLRRRLARARLQAWSDAGARVVVHTPSAAEILAEFLPRENIIVAGYPVEAITDATAAHRPVFDPPKLLFVGQARREKGAQVFLDALCRLTIPVAVTIAGPQRADQRQKLESIALPCPVTWIDRHLDSNELREQFAAADLVVLPYLDEFAAHGGASGVLIDTLANGRPLVTTDALADQLPDEYGGAVAVRAGDPDALAAGIESALGRVSEMDTSARSEGPRFVRTHHSYESYLNRLLGHG